MNRWIALFAGACQRAVSDARQFEERVRRLQAAWRERAGNPRRDSAVHRRIERFIKEHFVFVAEPDVPAAAPARSMAPSAR